MRNQPRGRRYRLLPEQRKRGSPIYRCRYCGALTHRDKGASLTCDEDKSCACNACVSRMGLDSAPVVADLLAEMREEVRHG